MSKIAIIDYGLNNLRSVAGAVSRCGFECVITSDSEDMEKADKLILPGVGAFKDAMESLNRLGLVGQLNEQVIEKRKPILGICLGAQLMCRESYEFGHCEGLGWIDASVEALEAGDDLRVPHVGWNELYCVRDSVLLDEIGDESLFYYVHSYRISCVDRDVVCGECEYGVRFDAAIEQGNIYATQFHPEKSQLEGLKLMHNFLEKV